MKKINHFVSIGTLILTMFFVTIDANAQSKTPRGSQNASVTQTVGISKIYINYSRPSVNGREIWGKLVPYGMNNLGFGTATEQIAKSVGFTLFYGFVQRLPVLCAVFYFKCQF